MKGIYFRGALNPIYICIVLLAISFSLILNANCVAPGNHIETYVVTETRQEPYTVEEKYVINGASHTEELFSSNGFNDYVGGDRSTVGAEYRFSQSSYKAGTTPAQNIPDTNCLESKVILGGGNFAYYQSRACAGGTAEFKPNMRVILEWKTASLTDTVMGLVMYTDMDATYKNIGDLVPIDIDNDSQKTMKTAASGKVVYHPTDGRPFFIGLIRGKELPGVVHCWYRATCEWDDMTIGTRNVIRYRDVQVQVEKQRVVENNQTISLFGASSGKSESQSQENVTRAGASPNTGPDSNQTSNSPTSMYSTFDNKARGISFTYPNTWSNKINTIKHDENLIAAFQSPESCNSLSANFNIIYMWLGKNNGSTEFFETGHAALKALPQYAAISTSIVTINDSKAVQHNYTNVSSGIVQRFQQYFIVQDNWGYLMTFTCSPDCFNRYESDFDKIANSFRVVK